MDLVVETFNSVLDVDLHGIYKSSSADKPFTCLVE